MKVFQVNFQSTLFLCNPLIEWLIQYLEEDIDRSETCSGVHKIVRDQMHNEQAG